MGSSGFVPGAAVHVPMTRERLARTVIYLLAGNARFSVGLLGVFLAAWYWMSGVYLEPLLLPRFGPWNRSREMWFLLVPLLYVGVGVAGIAWRSCRIPKPFEVARLRPGQQRPIGVWVRSLNDAAAMHPHLGGRLIWMANRLGHRNPDDFCTMEQLPGLVNRQWRVWPWPVVLLTTMLYLTVSPEWPALAMARIRGAGAHRPLRAAECSEWTGACQTNPIQLVLEDRYQLDVDVDPAGRFEITFDAAPRNWLTVHVRSDGLSNVRFAYGDRRDLWGQATIHGNALIVFYAFEPTQIVSTIVIDAYEADGQHSCTEIRMRNTMD